MIERCPHCDAPVECDPEYPDDYLYDPKVAVQELANATRLFDKDIAEMLDKALQLLNLEGWH